MRFGVRNKLQIKRGKQPYDLADVDVFTTYSIERPENTDPIQSVMWKGSLRPASWMMVDFDGSYSVSRSVTETFNTRLRVHAWDLWSMMIEHRYRVDESNLLSFDCTLLPERPWSCNANGRYETDGGRFETARRNAVSVYEPRISWWI